MENKKSYRIIYNSIVVLLLLAGIYFVINRFMHFGNVEFTDNATVQRHITPVNTRVSGFIKEIRFEEYASVKKGDTLVIIEDTEFCLQLAVAEADLANAEAGKRAVSSGISTTQTSISAVQAAADEAEAHLANARREEARYARLLANRAVTQQQYDNVKTALLAAEARYNGAVRQRDALSSTKNEQGHHLAGRDAGIRLAEARIELARLNLSYTVIIATADGVVGKKDIHVGQLVQPGQTLLDIVDESDLWIVANYRETQLQHIGVGSKVEVKVDAMPDVVFEGTVERISDATGSAYSLVPQDNATGNFVKVEQRIPVRIRLAENENIARLRAGMNVECEVKYE